MAILAAAMLLIGQALDDGGSATVAEPAPVDIDVEAPTKPLSPYGYLYAEYPLIAKRMDCVIARESKWDAAAVNPRSGATGLAQFLRSTWLTTPPGRAGLSRLDPYASIDGAAWLARNSGWSQWTVVLNGYC